MATQPNGDENCHHRRRRWQRLWPAGDVAAPVGVGGRGGMASGHNRDRGDAGGPLGGRVGTEGPTCAQDQYRQYAEHCRRDEEPAGPR
ncbi:MAG: hypothetical protein Q8K72_13820 [Acidimicrobiales bacterium]|nr:hypothetical protein [Acidimicrobiales bacterium]